ncbi:response regulator transcription factor [Paenibacillus lemnae]|uniref:response regulator transcription factor n=1 Tax=Paenibacillus lemnae TaxID=1330551 RepID=UPI001FE7B82F|nr:response regulator transcription factor [Paenibacillus lemnae]
MNDSVLLAVTDVVRRNHIQKWLQKAGYSILVAEHLSSAMIHAKQSPPDIIIVDSALEGMKSFQVLHSFQTEKQQVPVIVLGTDGTEEAAAALEAGANDYIFDWTDEREFKARVGNLIHLFRRSKINHTKYKEQIISIGDLSINPSSRQVLRSGKPIDLTRKEFELLLYLARRKDEVCAREEILMNVWDYDFHTGTNVVDVYILHLREKMDKGYKWKLIQTVRGAGYLLRTPAGERNS